MADLKETKDLIRELADLLSETNLTEIEFEREDVRIRVARGQSVAPTIIAAPAGVAAPEVAPAAEPEAPAELDPANHPGALRSPMVGTAFLSPEPGASQFVKEGDEVAVRNSGGEIRIKAKLTANVPEKAAFVPLYYDGGAITRLFQEDAPVTHVEIVRAS